MNNTLTIKDIADLKTGKKTLNRILKDGTYPKYLSTQIGNGIKETREAINSYLYTEEWYGPIMREEFAYLEHNFHNIKVEYDEETTAPKEVEWLGDYEKDGEPRHPMVEYFLESKAFKEYRMKWLMESMDNLEQELPKIKEWENYTPEQKKELGFKVYSLYSDMKLTNESTVKLTQLVDEAFEGEKEYNLKHKQNISNISKPFRKISNNLKKVNDKYSLGLSI